jgi:hypothetical protein
VIDSTLRAAVLANFPPGASLVVAAPIATGFAALVAARSDGTRFTELPLGGFEGDADMPAMTNMLVEGLDALDDPGEFLRKLSQRAPDARLFALVANAAYVNGLSSLFTGASPSSGHPLVLAELEPLLARSGWRTLAINAIADESIPVGRLPLDLSTSLFTLKVADGAMLERVRIRAFLVIADHA